MTTNVISIADASMDYLQSLLGYLETNTKLGIWSKASNKKLSEEEIDFELKTVLIATELAVKQALLWLEEAEKLDMLLHQHAADMSKEAWIENDKTNQRLFEMIISFGKAVLALCERPQALGLTVEKRELLATCVAEFERNMNWGLDDYADLPAFQEFMKEAVAEYKARKVEEGGWQFEVEED